MSLRKSPESQISEASKLYAKEKGLPHPPPRTLPPLKPNHRYILDMVERIPGISRAELGKCLFPKQHVNESAPRVSSLVEALMRRGLIEFGPIRESGRASVQGLYLVGKPRPAKPGYLGVNGWVEPKVSRNSLQKARKCCSLPLGGCKNSLIGASDYCEACWERLRLALR